MSKRLPNGLAWTLLGLTVRAELLGVVDSAVQPAHISIWTAGRGPE